MKEQSDALLLQEAARGNDEAWQQIVDIYSGRLHAFAVRQLGRRRAEAEDMVQETFIALAQNSDKLAGLFSLEAYLFTILRRKIIDFRRKRKAENLSDSHWQGHMMSPAETPSNVIARAELMAESKLLLAKAITDHVNQLKDNGKYRMLAALEMIFLKDEPGKSTAEALDMTPVQVSRAKQGALEELRQAIEAAFPGGTFKDNTFLHLNTQISLEALWEDNLFTCLKRSTLGAFEYDLLDPDLASYVAFHLTTLGCPYCHANMEDMKTQSEGLPELREKIFTTSTPFLRKS